MSRIGVYGGSFDPPHLGHVLAAEEAIRRLALDRLIVMPARQAPHKQRRDGSPEPACRLELTRMAFTTVPGAEISDLEIARQGVSYTVDTLRTLKERYPDDTLLLLMGTDMLLSFSTWREPGQIAAMAELAVMRRQDEDAQLREQVAAAAATVEKNYGGTVRFVDNRCIEVSSTEVRRMLALGVTDYRLPAPVAETIAAQGLYGCRAELGNLSEDALQEASLALHDEHRRAHVLGCCRTATALAERWNADVPSARRAALLHDVTKALAPEAQLALCTRWEQTLTDFEREHPQLLHAVTGAAAAGQVFHETEEVCGAIRWHTTGRADMTVLEKILYLADLIEPTRRFTGVERLRALAEANLDAAVRESLRHTITYLQDRNEPIDPHSREALEFLCQSEE